MKPRELFAAALFLFVFASATITVQANDKEGYNFLSVGVAEVLDPSSLSSEGTVETAEESLLHSCWELKQYKWEPAFW